MGVSDISFAVFAWCSVGVASSADLLVVGSPGDGTSFVQATIRAGEQPSRAQLPVDSPLDNMGLAALLTKLPGACIGRLANLSSCNDLLHQVDEAQRGLRPGETATGRMDYFDGGGTRVKLPQCGGGDLYYKHLWKAGGWAFYSNFAKFGETVGGGYDDSWHGVGLSNQMTGVDTFFVSVRHPADRFVSGYSHIFTSRYNPDDDARVRASPAVHEWMKGLSGEEARIGSVAHARAFVRDITRQDQKVVDGHMRLQASFINFAATNAATDGWKTPAKRPIDIVTHLESFGKDWGTVQKRLGCEGQPLEWRESQGKHESTSDPLGTTKAMKELLYGNDKGPLQQVCWYALPDFALFDYDMPSECGESVQLESLLFKSATSRGAELVKGRYKDLEVWLDLDRDGDDAVPHRVSDASGDQAT